jgi:signal transduction histidine kinase
LYLARRIIEAHGGQIGYARDAGQTVFWVELPEYERGSS